MKNIIVTGGAGFIGSNLVDLLIKKKYFIIIIDKLNYASNKKNFSKLPSNRYIFFKNDICNQKKISKIIKKYKPIGLFNLAAETHVDRSIDNADNFIKSNIYGVYSILQAIRQNINLLNKKFRFVHISTDEVFGDIKKNKFSKELDPYNPSSPYASSKASADLIIKSFVRTYNFPAIITNCCNNYGPKQFPEKLIPKIITKFLKNENIPIYGNGLQEREWLYVEDHCRALYSVFKYGKIGESYNIGSGEIHNNKFVTNMIIKVLKENFNLRSQSKIQYVKDRPGHDKRYALNSTKITKTKWKKKYLLLSGLIKTISWYLNNTIYYKKKKPSYFKRLGNI